MIPLWHLLCFCVALYSEMNSRKSAIRDVISVIKRWISSEIYGKLKFNMAVAEEFQIPAVGSH
jgi:hypothetical protein